MEGKKKALSKAKDHCKVAFLSIKLAPLQAITMIVLAFCTGPLLALATQKLGDLINSIPAYSETGRLTEPIIILLTMLALYLAGYLASYISQLMSCRVNERMQAYIIEDMMRMTSRVSYLDFISGEHRDKQYSILDYISVYLTYAVNGMISILRGVVMFVSYAVMLYSVVGIIPGIIGIVIVLVAAVVQSKVSIDSFDTALKNANASRRASYLDKLYRDKAASAEMELFSFSKRIRTLFEDNFETMASSVRKTNRKNEMISLILQAAIALASAFAIFAMFKWNQIQDAGQMMIALTSYFAMIGAAEIVSRSVGNFTIGARAAINYVDYRDKYQLKDTGASLEQESDLPLKLEHVSFSYGDHRVLEDISLAVEKGQTVALVGENGAGKTTLANIILGLFPCEGKAEVFGKDAFASRMASRNDAVAVLQRPAEHLGYSVSENIGFDRQPDADMLAELDPFFAEVNMDETVGEMLGGRNFSGGQWQKIALARCLTSNAGLAILDEPTAALDPITEAEVFARFVELRGNRANILITHRLGAVRNADWIYVLKDGKVFEQGTHDALMQRGGYYADMFNAQAQWYQ